MKVFIFILLSFSVFSTQALAVETPIYKKCEIEAEKTGLVYSDIFSIIISTDVTSPTELTRAMKTISSNQFAVLEWDMRTETQLRVFVTWNGQNNKSVGYQKLDELISIDGVAVLCVGKSAGF